MGKYLTVTYHAQDSLFVKCLGYEDLSEEAHWGPGYRTNCILHYVLHGKGYYNGNLVKENQGFFIENQQFQEYHSDTEEPWTYFWIMFSEEMAKKYVLPVLKPDSRQIFDYSFASRLQKLCKDFLSKASCFSHIRALEFLFGLLALQESHNANRSGLSLQHVENAKLLIEQNIHRKLTVKEIAADLHVDDRYLYNLFIRYEGISLKEYISRQKCDMACQLLAHTDLTISEIAGSTGFDEVCTFSKFFASREGLSPSSYRQKMQPGVSM